MYYTTIASISSEFFAGMLVTEKGKKYETASVLQYPTEHINATPARMLHVIALALNMSPECYKMKTRVRNIVELRFIASILLRQHFPALTLQQIASYFGGQDHTSVINAISRAHNLLYVRDEQFIKKYNTVLKSINSWLKKDA